MNEPGEVGEVKDGEEYPTLREEDVTRGDKLDDQVQEGEGLDDGAEEE